MGLQQFDEQLPFLSSGTLPNDGVSTIVNVAQASFRMLRVDSLYLGNSAVLETVVQIEIDDGSSDIGQLGGISIPGRAGYDTAAVEVISALCSPNQQFVNLPLQGALRLQVPGGAVGGSVVSFFTNGGYL